MRHCRRSARSRSGCPAEARLVDASPGEPKRPLGRSGRQDRQTEVRDGQVSALSLHVPDAEALFPPLSASPRGAPAGPGGNPP
jgi:hypothetical protein